MREGGQDGFALGLHKPAFSFQFALFVWLRIFHFSGILMLPLGVGRKVTVLFRDGVYGQKFVVVQCWKKPKAPEGPGLS